MNKIDRLMQQVKEMFPWLPILGRHMQRIQREDSKSRVLEDKMSGLENAKKESRRQTESLGRWLDEMRDRNGAT